MKCFESCDKELLRLQQTVNTWGTQCENRHTLSSFQTSRKTLLLNENRVRNKFWNNAFHFSNDLQNSVRKNMAARLLSEGAKAGVTPLIQVEGIDKHKRKAVLYILERLAESVCDWVIDKKEFYLPFIGIQDVYDSFWTEHKSLHGAPCLTYANFDTVFLQQCRTIKMRKDSGYALCSICEKLESALPRLLQLQQDLRSLNMKIMGHFRFFAWERLVYYKTEPWKIRQTR